MSASNSTESSTNKIVIGNLKYAEGKPSGFVPWQGGRYYIKLNLDGEVRQTTVSNKTSAPSWPDTFELSTSDSSNLILEICISHRVRSDEIVGRVEERVDSLLAQEVVSRTLEVKGPIGKRFQSVIAFNITQSSSDEAVPSINVSAGEVPTAHLIAQTMAHVNQMRHVPFEQLLERSETFFKIVAGVSELHPYAKVAFNVLSSAYKIMLAQKNRDEKIQQLVDSLHDLLHFLLYAGILKDLDPLTSDSYNLTGIQIQNLQLVSEQVTECAHFIIAYAQTKNAGVRIAKSIILDSDSTIKAYEDKFKKFKSNFEQHGILVTELTVLKTKFLVQQVLTDVEMLAANSDLNDLVYAEGASCSPDKACLPGTRQSIIDEIMDWIHQPTDNMSSQLLWLHGVAGSGKSSVAHSIAHRFVALNRLGSSFCFDAANQATRGPHQLFSTIARDLADFDVKWKQSLWDAVRNNKAIRKSHSVQSQFENFLVKPGQKLAMIGPVVIVIDALDECGDAASREIILAMLGTQLAALPGNFRIIVTSRAEPDIVKALQSQTNILCKDMASIDLSQTKKDIEALIVKKLDWNTKKSLARHHPNWHHILAEKADGLFQWAITACLFIEQPGYLPIKCFEVLLKGSGGSQLDRLYEKILKQSFPYQDSDAIERFQAIMGALLAVKQPLPRSALNFLCFEQDADTVHSVLVPLGAVLSGVTSDSALISTLHASFRDFLGDKTRSGIFHVEAKKAHQNLALACLDIMLRELQFNICKLQTSCEMNHDIADMDRKVQDHIPNYLSYACIFWADHLEHVEYKHSAEMRLEEFMKSKLLYWLEVLSLTQKVGFAVPSLQKVARWTFIHNKDLTALVRDAQAFVANFWTVISESVPHIYLSALPFAPEESLVARTYLQLFQNTLIVTTGKEKHWPQLNNVVHGHTDWIRVVSFSPDSLYIASGSDDRTIRVWDAETGHAVGVPLKGHTGSVQSVAFSPDGKHIASSSEDHTIRFWDTEAGCAIGEPLKGDMGSVWSIAFSPDGKQIASGSEDNTIRLWDVATGNIIGEPLQGHTDTIWSVTFSPDGVHIASSSSDTTIRIWNTETSSAVGEPLRGHTGAIWSVVFSPDGKYIASGSDDKTIRIWSAETGHAVGEPLKGHRDYIRSIAFSPDGKHIASASVDNTIRIWDVKTGYNVGLLEGHTKAVWSVAFSSDGMYIASGSSDNTVMIWDANIYHATERKLEMHTDHILSVALSPDGKYIASGSGDNTIRVWDIETGHAMGDPFTGHTDSVLSVAFSPDSKNIISGSLDRTIQVWDAETGHAVDELLKGHKANAMSVTFSPDGKQIASGLSDNTIRMWDAKTGCALGKPLEGHTHYVRSVAFSPDGRYIASCSEDSTIRMWDAETGHAVGEPLKGHTDGVYSVGFSPDGRYIVSCSSDKTIRVWDTNTGHAVGQPLKGHTDYVRSVAFSPDGMYIASGSDDETIRVWKIEHRGDLLEGYIDQLLPIASSSDSKNIPSGSEGSIIKEKGHMMGEPFRGHTSWIRVIAFLPDGKHIVSGSNDRTIRIWDVEQAFKPITSPFQNGFSIHNSWASAYEKVLFWVPPSNHKIHPLSQNTLVIGGNPTYTNLSHFVYDTEWEKCKTSTAI